MIVVVALLPGVSVTGLGAALKVKVPSPFTVNVSVVVATKAPEVPVIVTVTVPLVAVELAVKVKVLLLVAGLGLNLAVTPSGKPDTARLTGPGCGAMRIVLVPLKPCTRVNVFGEGDNVRPGFTESWMVAVCTRLPDVPVIVTVAVPVVAVALAAKVRALVEVPGLGLNAAVTPWGRPEAARVTLAEKPFTGVIVMVLFAWPS